MVTFLHTTGATRSCALAFPPPPPACPPAQRRRTACAIIANRCVVFHARVRRTRKHPFLSAPSHAMPLCSPVAFLRSRPPSPSHITLAASIFPLHVLFRGESPRIAAAAPHPGGRAERRRRDGNHAVAPRDVNKIKITSQVRACLHARVLYVCIFSEIELSPNF